MRNYGLEEAQCYDCGHHHRIPNPKVSIECGFHNVGHSVCACQSKYREPMKCRACGHHIQFHQPVHRGASKYKCQVKSETQHMVRGLIRVQYHGCNCNLDQREVLLNSLAVTA